MYFGMTNSPATFQALMNSVFADLIAKGQVAVYMDDILIYSKILKEHRQVVREVLKRLEHYDLYLKPKKCKFKNVKAPPMVGPTWTRVHFTLGSDWLPALSQGTAMLLPRVSGTAYCSHVHDLMIQMI